MEELGTFNTLIIIGGIITFISNYHNKEQEKYNKLIDTYFEKVLVTYIKAYKNSNDLNPVKYIKKRYTMEDYYIPSYVFYLVENNEKEKLHKVLMEDYKENFPNSTNGIWKAMDSIVGIFSICMSLIFVVMSILIGVNMVNVILNYLSYLITNIGKVGISEPLKATLGLIVSIGICILLFYVMKYSMNVMVNNGDDTYKFKVKNIKKSINRKIKKYDKRGNDYYIM